MDMEGKIKKVEKIVSLFREIIKTLQIRHRWSPVTNDIFLVGYTTKPKERALSDAPCALFLQELVNVE
tara:strand:- start:515 stop:718 length:204 start_codon:yes stop_codon:yes gene_type:complete